MADKANRQSLAAGTELIVNRQRTDFRVVDKRLVCMVHAKEASEKCLGCTVNQATIQMCKKHFEFWSGNNRKSACKDCRITTFVWNAFKFTEASLKAIKHYQTITGNDLQLTTSAAETARKASALCGRKAQVARERFEVAIPETKKNLQRVMEDVEDRVRGDRSH